MNTNTARSEQEGDWSIDARIVAIVMSAFALFGPLGMSVSSNIYEGVSVLVIAVAWGMIWEYNIPVFVLGGGIFVLFGILRLLFVQQMYRCYRLQVTRRHALKWGTFSELQDMILFVQYLFLAGQPLHLMPIIIPIPLLLIIGLLFLIITPPQRQSPQWPQAEVLQA